MSSLITQLQSFFASLPFPARLLAAVGLFTLVKPFYRLVRILLDCYVLGGIPLSTFGPNKNDSARASWALVTGATDGIGKEFALQLAKKVRSWRAGRQAASYVASITDIRVTHPLSHTQGFNIILASRTQSKLDAVSSEITSSSPSTKVKTVAVNFLHATDADYERLESSISDVKLAVLVNNVGLSHDKPVLFAEGDVQEMEAIAEVNVRATLRVTRIALPLLQRNKRE